MFASNIVIGITFYGFEAGQKLVRSRSNYFTHDGQRALSRESDLGSVPYKCPVFVRSFVKNVKSLSENQHNS